MLGNGGLILNGGTATLAVTTSWTKLTTLANGTEFDPGDGGQSVVPQLASSRIDLYTPGTFLVLASLNGDIDPGLSRFNVAIRKNRVAIGQVDVSLAPHQNGRFSVSLMQPISLTRSDVDSTDGGSLFSTIDLAMQAVDEAFTLTLEQASLIAMRLV